MNFETELTLITIPQAAKLISGLTTHTIRQLCIQNKVPCIMTGNKYLIDKQGFIDYLHKTLANHETLIPTRGAVNGIH